jgi:hypothetical protein
MELYNTYKDNIEISKIYLDRMNSNYYSWIQYNKVIQLILEYEAYFSTKNYYIRLHNDFYIIATYERNPFIEYVYITNKNKLELKNISKNLAYLNNADRKEYEYK